MAVSLLRVSMNSNGGSSPISFICTTTDSGRLAAAFGRRPSALRFIPPSALGNWRFRPKPAGRLTAKPPLKMAIADAQAKLSSDRRPSSPTPNHWTFS